MRSVGWHLALTRYWWSWDAPEIRRVVQTPVLVRVESLVGQWFQANKSSGSGPTHWRDLTFLRRDEDRLKKYSPWTTVPTTEFLLGLAAAMKVDLSAFHPPTTRDWVAEAAVALAVNDRRRIHREQGYTDRKAYEMAKSFDRSVLQHDAAIYADAVLSRVPWEPCIHSASLELWLKLLDPKQRPAVESVANALADQIERIDRELDNSKRRLR